jgi:hypothetical protein
VQRQHDDENAYRRYGSVKTGMSEDFLDDEITEITLDWSSNFIPFENVRNNKNNLLVNNGFYAIYTAKPMGKGLITSVKLQYIGQAYDQTLRERIPQPHVAYEKIENYIAKHQGFHVYIKTGIITDCNVARKTQDLFDDIENCLIYENQPAANTEGKDAYIGRALILNNIGKPSKLTDISMEYETA